MGAGPGVGEGPDGRMDGQTEEDGMVLRELNRRLGGPRAGAGVHRWGSAVFTISSLGRSYGRATCWTVSRVTEICDIGFVSLWFVIFFYWRS